jgi:iron(II)-dependent oxidoreductase
MELTADLLPAALEGALTRARARTLDLLAPFEDDVLLRQHDPLMSPLVWDLAHVANYEDLWLLRSLGATGTVEGIDDLYDAFKQPRRIRESLPMLRPAEARQYSDDVRARVLDHLASLDLDPAGPDPLRRGGAVHRMVIQHEHQHAETLLASIQLLPPAEGYVRVATSPPLGRPVAATEVRVPSGAFTMGTDDPLAYDNERPAHSVDVPAYWIDVMPVTNAAYAEFVAAGGYDDARWWTAEGWAWRQEAGLVAPQFWMRVEGGWWRRRFGTLEPLPDDEPVQHVCWYEADAYARWAGKRLPTEAEWEKAVAYDPLTGLSSPWPWGHESPEAHHANLGQRHLGPAPVGAYPAGVSAVGCHQMVGDVWEWTSTDFSSYPGFVAFPYEEYSAVFHGSDYKVLRGGSWAGDLEVTRTTFRNWDFPIRRQIFAGFRCARDDDGGAG